MRGDLTGVKTKIKKTRAQIRETKKREVKITTQIETVETRLLSTEDRLLRARSRLRELKGRQAQVKQRIEETERRLEGRRRLLADRIRQNYIRGKTSYAHVVVGSRSIHDYLSRSYYIERIVESDVVLVEGMKADRKQLAADKALLDAQTAEQSRLRDELVVESAAYRDDVDQKRDLLHEVHETRANLEEALDQLEESSRDIEQRIRAMEQTPRGQARMARAFTGGFIRPASGPITSGFGMRHHPILGRDRMHTGVDIGAGYGSSIHAAAAGEVIFAGYERGYGNTVIIDHGGGVTTLYGHCSRLLVSAGQQVGQGQVVARVGSTGLSTGPHLHFEVRRNGTPVNPL